MCIVVSSLKTLIRHNVFLNFKFDNNRSKLALILMLIKLNRFYLNIILN